MSIVEKALNAARRRATDAKSNDVADSAAVALVATSAPGQRSAIAHERIRLDIDALRAVGAMPPLDCERQLTEQYRRIKRPLVAFALGGANPDAQVNGSLIMVTSSFPAEGKTFTSLNLSVSLSLEKDASVLLVDADIANPRLSTLLARRGARGLFDALGQESLDAETLVVDTDIPGLSFLPAGTTTHESSELLASHRMASLMASLVDNDPRRLVVLDSPPLLLTNESRELASVAGQVLLVVRAGVTPQESVKEAAALIPDGKHVGVVLNQVDPSSSDVSYYGYGRYGAYSEKQELAMRVELRVLHAAHRGMGLAAAVLCASSAAAAPLFTDLTLSSSVGWSDNISGVATNQQTETMVGVGVQGVIGGNRQRSGLNGRFDLQYTDYVNDKFDDQVNGSADLEGRYELVPEMLSLVVEDTFGQTQTSAFAPSTPETRQNTNFLSAGPDLRFDLPGSLLFLGSARYVVETYETTQADNTRWQGTGGLHYEFSGRSSLGLLAQAQDVSFSDSAPYDDFSRREMLLRYRIDAPRTTLQADGGRSEFRGRGVQQLRQNMWIYRVTVSRDLTARSEVDLSIGREISDGGDLFAASMERFGASGSLRTMGLGAVQAIGNGVLATGDAMKTFHWGASWRITGPRSSGYVGVEGREERYFSALSPSRDSLAVFAGFTRSLSNRMSFGLDVRSGRREAEVTTIKVEDISVTLSGGYAFTQRLALSASFEFTDRKDSGAGGDYGDHRAWVRLGWSPTRR